MRLRPTRCGASPSSRHLRKTPFTRNMSDGWGAADVGGTWAVLRGSASNFVRCERIEGNARHAGGKRRALHRTRLALRSEARVDVILPAAFSGSGTVYTALLFRSQSSGAQYRIGLLLTGSNRVFLSETDAGTSLFPDADTALGVSPGDAFVLRVQTQGANPTILRARAWRSGAPEPTGWSVVAPTAPPRCRPPAHSASGASTTPAPRRGLSSTSCS